MELSEHEQALKPEVESEAAPEVEQTPPVKSILINKKLAKVTGRGRPKNAKNKKDIDPAQPTTSQLAENRDALDMKLLALIIISPQCELLSTKNMLK